jgi:hypothetical protein
MARFSALITLVVAISSSAFALEIWKFDQMSDQDQGEYIAELIVGAQKVLNDDRKPEFAEQVHKLFNTKDPEGNMSIGMTQFEIVLAKARLADLQRTKKAPGARRLEVEDAMIVALRKNGIELPTSFLTVAKDFKPKYPPKKLTE